jgi:hypothetical protein
MAKPVILPEARLTAIPHLDRTRPRIKRWRMPANLPIRAMVTPKRGMRLETATNRTCQPLLDAGRVSWLRNILRALIVAIS